MQLSGRGVRCVRGGREVLSGLDFTVSSGEALAVTGANGSGKTSLLRTIAGHLALTSRKSIDLEGGDAELTLAEQAHYLGHRDALKPALQRAGEPGVLAGFLGGERSDAGKPRGVGLGHAARLPAGYLSAGQRRRLSIARLLAVPGRSGCSMSRPRHSIPPDKRIFAGLMHNHLAGGGNLAATHAPLASMRRNCGWEGTRGSGAAALMTALRRSFDGTSRLRCGSGAAR